MLRLTGLPKSIELARQGFALQRLNFLGAWQHTRGSSSVPIGHIGTGLATTTRELAGVALPITGWNMPANSSNVVGDGSQGFSTGSAAALVGRGGTAGTWGFCHDSPLIHVKYANAPATREEEGWLTESQASADSLAAAILKTFDLGARIIVVTQVLYSDYTVLRDACATVWNGGGIVVASAGQPLGAGGRRLDEPRYPAAYPNVICVGAVTQTDNAAGMDGNYGWFNVYGSGEHGGAFGSRIDVVAPYKLYLPSGKTDGFYTTLPYGIGVPGYPLGPPQAALAVAGVANLTWSANPSLTNAQVRSIVVSEVDKSDAGWMFYGYFTKPGVGIPDAERAVLRAKAIGANDGTVFPYLRPHAADRLNRNDGHGFSPIHHNVRYYIGSDGTCDVAVRGAAGYELGGYCCVGGVEKPITNVKLILDGATVYDGAPTSRAAGDLFQFTSYRNDYYDVRVVATTATGETATRTYAADYDANPATTYASATYVTDPTEAPVFNAVASPTSDDPIVITGRVPSYLEGALTFTATTTANLTTPITFAGSLSTSTTVTADLTVPKPLAADLAFTAQVGGDLTTVALEVTVSPVFNTVDSPNSTGDIYFTGSIPGNSISLSGSVYGGLVISGDLVIPTSHPLMASLTGGLTLDGDLTAPASHPLVGEVACKATMTARMSGGTIETFTVTDITGSTITMMGATGTILRISVIKR